MGDHVGAQVLPLRGVRVEPPGQLLGHPDLERWVEGIRAGHGRGHQAPPGRCVSRGHLAHDGQVADRAAPGAIEGQGRAR